MDPVWKPFYLLFITSSEQTVASANFVQELNYTHSDLLRLLKKCLKSQRIL